MLFMKPLRACPICTNCGSKKFERISDTPVTVRCKNFDKIIKI